MTVNADVSQPSRQGSSAEVLRVFSKLGVTSFGGPIAHLGYFRTEFVERREWMTDREYADLVALCQLLPGPASSQVGFGIGLLRAGFRGAVAAFVAFTLPSALLMLAFAYGAPLFAGPVGEGVLAGLKIVAVDQIPRRTTALVPLVLMGKVKDGLRERGIHQLAATQFSLSIDDQFILDGEAFPAGEYRIEQGPELAFVAP